MRTTLTLDPDVAEMLKAETHRQHRSFKQVVNDAIRRGLAPTRSTGGQPPFKVEPHRTTLRPGVDAATLNRMNDELEDEAALAKHTAAP